MRANLQALLAVMALAEAATGLLLLAMPSMLVGLLLGTALDGPAAAVVARIGGVALLALGVACWLARTPRPDGKAGGVVAAMLLYNAGVAAVLLVAALVHGMAGIGLWPVILAHSALAAWCIVSLTQRRRSDAAASE